MKKLIFTLGFLAVLLASLWGPPLMAADKAPDDAADLCSPISGVDIEGNRAFSALRLKLRMKTWSKYLFPGADKCLNDDWLRKDIQNLTAFYRKKGYADVVIEFEVVPGDPGGEGRLVLHISEGLKYKFQFQGHHYLNRWQLKSEIEIFKKGNINDHVLSRNQRSIQKRYNEAGFADASVTYEKVKQGDGDKAFWRVLFTIEERGRIVVSSVTINGNGHIDEKEIRQAMLTRPKGALSAGGFSKKILNEDINAIELLYRSRGFRNIAVEKRIIVEGSTAAGADETAQGEDENNYPDTTVSVVLTMAEGEKVVVTDAGITGIDDLFTEEELIEKISLRPGEPFRDYMIKSDANLIASLISEKGYPHVDVRGEFKLDDTGKGAGVSWKVDRGVFTTVGEISYLGNLKLKTSIMEAQLETTPGEAFSLKKIMGDQKRLRKINAVKTVKVHSPDLQEKKEVADIEVVIEENKPYYIETAIGYDTERLEYFTSEIGDTDFLGRDINSAISVETSAIGYEVQAGLKDHFFLGTDMTAASKIYFEKEEELNHDFGVEAWGASGTLSKPITQKLSAGIGLAYENRTRYGDEAAYASYADEDEGDDDAYETRNIFITSLFATYDSRDSTVRPRRGVFTAASTDIYTGVDNDLDKFFKCTVDIRGYRTVWERVTFALRARFGYIHPYGGGSDVAEDQLFFLGGTTNVRGFDEDMLVFDGNGDPAGGKAMVHGTLESRISITSAIELSLFLDSGQIRDIDNEEGNDSGMRSAVGMGVNYITPIGPVSLMYGRKLHKEEGESDGEVHFSIGYTF